MNNNLSTDNYEEVKEDVVTTQSSNNNNDNEKNEFRSKIIKMFIIVIIGLIIFLVIGFIISLVTKKNYTYASLEDEMKDAAVEYFKDNKSKLPKNTTEIVEIDATILANNKYMKTLDKYISGEECTGKVTVEKTDEGSYVYTPYLTCNDGGYTTTKLYEEIAKADNVVTEGFGIYYMNNEYVYRGTDVANYVRFSDSEVLWRIVKVTSNNEVVLISNKITNNKFVWDERYNNAEEDTTGINLYKNSTISTLLNKVYDNSINTESVHYDDEIEFLTEEDRKKVVEFNSCVGNRSTKDSTRDGSSECSVVEKTKMSLLPVYDYLNASLDVNCNATTKKDCQNYNYLASGSIYWLANGPKENTGKVYQVSGSGYIYTSKASREAYVKVVIHVGDNAMLEKGTGTKTDPYVIR